MTPFADALRSNSGEPLEISPDWMQGRATFGGLVAALGLEALRRGVDPSRLPRSVHAAFIGPVGPGPVEITTTVLREGRSFTHSRAELLQDGSVRAQITAALGAARPSKLDVQPPRLAGLPDPESLQSMPYWEGVMPAFVQHVDFRYASPHFPFSGGDTAVLEGYVRLRDPLGQDGQPLPVHATILALLDAWPSPILCLAKQPIPASSVTWSTTFAAVPEVIDPDGFWGFRGRVEHATGGHVAARGELYGPDGRLAAIEEQLVAVFDG